MSKVWRYGDHVDTDVIIPARYLNIADFDELAEHAMEDIDTTLLLTCSRATMLLPAKTSAVVLRASMLLSLSKLKA